MEKKYLEVLEYPKVLAKLAEYTSFSGGRDLALSLAVVTDLEEARRRQKETSEAALLLDTKAAVSLGGAHDIRPLLDRATRGLRLLPQELLDIESTLMAAQPLRRTLSRLGGQFPLLASLAARIEECGPVVSEIKRCITPKGEVADSASAELARIRSQLAIARDRLLQRLERMIMSPDNAGYLQEPLITQRGGRYVIPIKAEYKGRIQGLVHDESASGATLFIEPLATVELNNEWREWQLREEREVMRILDGLTGLVAKEAAFIDRTVAILAQFDLIFARARYAQAIHATEPLLLDFAPRQALDEGQGIYHPGTHLRLMRARHPLLPQDMVVPIDAYLRLGPRGYFALLITGPNTGGKTVALKTIGLLCLMAQAGLHIPAAEGSALSVFDGIYADIGDEQSIEQSLSTFSSHMGNIVHILAQATDRSLVLLDELGAGTDPVEGSALGRSLLTELIQRGITTVATTHHPELKVFAQGTAGVENASVEFDAETLAPTYELSIGLPGRSNAFAIAERLGLAHAIVERARTLVDPRLLQTDELLTQAKLLRDQAEARLQQADEKQRLSEQHEKELSQRLAEITAAREEALDQARQQARLEMEALRQEIAQARTQLAKARAAGEVTQTRQTLAAVEAMEQSLASKLTSAPVAPTRPGEEPRVGDVVWVKSLQTQGVVTAVEDGQAEVTAGNLRLRVVLEELAVREPAAATAEASISAPYQANVRVSAAAIGKPELHLRGLRVEEAMPELHRYLDDSYLAGLRQVRIVHGKGTGALRRLVREELAHHPLVAAVRQGQPYEGGDGVTIAELVPRYA
ncbi:MAG: endonuclease MutS2 [Anaerolineae bacterium]